MQQHISGSGRGFLGSLHGIFSKVSASPFSRAGIMACIALLVVSVWTAHAQKGTAIAFLADNKAALTIDEASSADLAGEYQTYIPSFMAFSRLSGDFNGAVWLRFALGPTFERPSGPVRVDLGTSLPGTSRLYLPKVDGGFSVMESLPPQGIFTLPADMPLPDIFYARIDGAPGLWFRPVVGAIPDAVRDIPMHMVLAGIFGFAMLVLLVKYVRQAEEWRLWAAITAGCGIVAAIVPPTPAAGRAFTPLYAAAMMMPGLSLLFFTHTARHLLSSPKTMPGSDKIFILYYLIGGATALLPLVPGFLWVSRYLPLAALLLIPLLPIAMISLSGSLKGGTSFFCACLLPVAGVAASAWELTSTDLPLIWGLGGALGMAFGMVVFAFTGPMWNAKTVSETADDVFDSLDKASVHPDVTLGPVRPRTATSPKSAAVPKVSVPTEGMVPADAENATSPGSSPVVQKPDEDSEQYPDLSLFNEKTDETGPPAHNVPAAAPKTEPLSLAPAVPAKTPEPVVPAPPACPAPAPAAPAATSPAPVVSAPITIKDDEPDTDLETVPDMVPPRGETSFMPEAPLGHGRNTLFDLPLLIKEAYDGPAQIAESKGVDMSWYIAPRTGRLFEGEADLLDSALRLLLRDMVDAIDKGNVRLNVRRMPDSTDAGHVTFTVTEWDAKQNARPRNMAGLAEAWSLAEKTGGLFSVDHSPSGGTTVIFSAVLTAMDKTRADAAPPFEAARVAGDGAADHPDAASPKATALQHFVDYPDIAMPSVPEIPVGQHVPPGLDGDELAEESETGRNPLRVIVADTTSSGRARTAAALTRSPYSVLECASPSAARTLYMRHPSGLLLMNADMPEMDIAAAIRDVHAEDARTGRSPALFLILVEHAQQADRMLEVGAVRTLMKPAEPEEILALVSEMLPIPKPAAEVKPLPVPAPAVLSKTPGTIALPPQPAGAKPSAPVTAPVAARVQTLPAVTKSAPAVLVKVGGTPPPKIQEKDAQSGPKVAVSVAPAKTAPAPKTPPQEPSVEKNTAEAPAREFETPRERPGETPRAVPATAKPVTVTVGSSQKAPEPPKPAEKEAPANTPKEAETRTALLPEGVPAPETVLHEALTDIPPVGEEAKEEKPAGQPEIVESGIFSTALPAEKNTLAAPEAEKSESGKKEDKKNRKDEPGLALLDMIITDEEEIEEKTAPPTPEAENKEKGKNKVSVTVTPNKNKTAKPKAGKQSQAPVSDLSRPAPDGADPLLDETVIVDDVGGIMTDGASAASGSSIPLPGEEDSVFKDMIPLVPGLIFELTDAMKDAARGREEKSPILVQQAAERVAGKAESFGLTKLERMARCVERAAAADDIEPMECVLDDLESWIERYKDALTKVHRDMQW